MAVEHQQDNDGDQPQQTDDDRQTVQVPLGHGGATHRGRHTSTEEVRQTAALALVKEDKEGEDDAQHAQDDGHRQHGPGHEGSRNHVVQGNSQVATSPHRDASPCANCSDKTVQGRKMTPAPRGAGVVSELVADQAW